MAQKKGATTTESGQSRENKELVDNLPLGIPSTVHELHNLAIHTFKRVRRIIPQWPPFLHTVCKVKEEVCIICYVLCPIQFFILP